MFTEEDIKFYIFMRILLYDKFYTNFSKVTPQLPSS
jgi:hypothetical protein